MRTSLSVQPMPLHQIDVGDEVLAEVSWTDDQRLYLKIGSIECELRLPTHQAGEALVYRAGPRERAQLRALLPVPR